MCPRASLVVWFLPSSQYPFPTGVTLGLSSFRDFSACVHKDHHNSRYIQLNRFPPPGKIFTFCSPAFLGPSLLFSPLGSLPLPTTKTTPSIFLNFSHTHTHTHTFRAISWFLLDSEPRLISPANQTLSRAWEGLSEEACHYKTQLSNQFTEALTTDTLELRAVEPASYQPSDQLFKYSALRHWHIYTTICKMDNCYMAQGAQLSALWSPRGIGRAGEALEGGDIWTHIADSLGCTTETNITIYSNYTPTIIF